MADHVILINGLPGAGKTTLAATLGPSLGVPVIAKDAITEALAAAAPALQAAAFGPAAAAAMWETRPLDLCPAITVRTDRSPDLPDLRRSGRRAGAVLTSQPERRRAAAR